MTAIPGANVSSLGHFEDFVSFEQQKEIVTERDAVGVLCYLIPAYAVTYILFGYAVNITQMGKYPIEVQQSWGVNKHWLSVFHSASA
ncbi:hypothetical protein CLAFUW4_03555 [Fulvia fulva]|uniref:Uncharacterized protein n=1 Tax=Passalora fulva TaxID=5499 RepID=A0A9Q8LBF1_PASFU|nr:uncharacterized protein CLAFUR5_03535 [Fulvia fulva]KAK4631212.1 hypothetical protein CLAFUR4_03544 [Fulvia fulva]KAK4633616.1 hypothetical protein CLAFUR0_03549 [Fulvia fulva]UJO14275.1 hypothetical protein CLAFUR5_03535 [Fulvia fulva]WPV10701.1 hypothetical protein CLAFUW4_03555 [Fulvia fulva]WPV26115.1 hypothetical protein CLAFUW7_03547 [Fulvia fulva]